MTTSLDYGAHRLQNFKEMHQNQSVHRVRNFPPNRLQIEAKSAMKGRPTEPVGRFSRDHLGKRNRKRSWLLKRIHDRKTMFSIMNH